MTFKHFFKWQGQVAIEDLSAQGAALDVIHQDKGQPSLGFQAVRAHDVRVLEFRQGLGFAPEAAQEDLVLGQVGVQDFHRQVNGALVVPNLVNFRHAAATEKFVHPVAVE
jgi:hypothetical protein